MELMNELFQVSLGWFPVEMEGDGWENNGCCDCHRQLAPTEFLRPYDEEGRFYLSIRCKDCWVEREKQQVEKDRQRKVAFRKSDLLKLAGAHCKICGSVEDLEVDHIVPVSKGGRTLLENLQILCRPCHDGKHSRRQ